MADYKETLNLPNTVFPMKANLAVREPAMLKFWDELKLYQQIRATRAGRPKYILHDGPPYANGHLHCGHALNKILKDIIIKAKSLSGFDSPYVPGWDCHGLPIELNVEKKLGKSGMNISHADFRKKCREYANSQIDIQREEFKRLGVIGDWDNPYVTMDFKYEANIIRALAQVVAQGYLHQGFKPVHWCIDCGSALAEAEVEYENKSSPAIDVNFKVLDEKQLLSRLNHSPDTLGQGPICVPIWTTTPWTLPANQAVTVNPNIDYSLVQCVTERGPQRLLLAEALIKDVMLRYGIEDYRVVAYGPGNVLDGIMLQHPFYARQVPIILGEHVTIDAGTGCVHTAPAHGPDDYAIGIKYGLAVDNPVLANGCFAADIELFAGEHVLKANQHIIEVLKQHGHLLHAEMIEHSYPHCWRHKTPVIFRATAQWFISMDKHHLREKTLQAINQVTWTPDWGKARIAGMVENRPDWCISRQRSWGTPITLFIHKETQALHPEMVELIEQIAQRVELRGVDAWFDLDPQELLGEAAQNYEKVTDTLDVWFDSGVSHFCVLKQFPALAFPADLYLEGSDQHRGWFNSSLTTAMAIDKQPPFKTVLTHGFTVDASGKKMSKSRGNYITPEQLVKTSGAEILRLWVAATDYRAELTISDEIMTRMSDAYRRIRNTARFLLANLLNFEPSQHQVNSDKLLALDKWAIDRAQQLQREIIQAYDEFNFHLIYQKVHNFCAVDMGSFYLDIIKDRQYTTQRDSVARRSCQTAMYHIISALVHWLAPILSFTAEEIWQHLPGERESSIFLSQWYQDFPQIELSTLNQEYWMYVGSVRNAVNKHLEVARAAGVIGSGLAADVVIYAEPEIKLKLTKIADELRFVLITSSAKVLELTHKTENAASTDIAGLFVEVIVSPHPKCERCWHRRADVGKVAAYPDLCSRCVENVAGKGEVRQYA